VAFFDRLAPHHKRCVAVLQQIDEPLFTTIPVLTEAFHILTPDSQGAGNFRASIVKGGMSIWYMDDPAGYEQLS
jgi:hypothetical protein